MITCRTLDELPAEMIYQTFMEAFSDYQVKIKMTADQFDRMNERRGYSPDYSAAAFFEDRCVGILLNGLRIWNGELTAYDMGTGVIPSFRSSGVTTQMMDFMREKLKAGHVKQYLLEVIQENEPALNLYRKLGFRIERELCCYRMDRSDFILENNHHVEQISQHDWTLFRSFWDFSPSWQNSQDSVAALGKDFRYYAAYYDGEIAGYLIADAQSGEIPQFAVRKDARNKGLGGGLFRTAINEMSSDSISVLNVESSQSATQSFLASCGFRSIVKQYEMMQSLQ